MFQEKQLKNGHNQNLIKEFSWSRRLNVVVSATIQVSFKITKLSSGDGARTVTIISSENFKDRINDLFKIVFAVSEVYKFHKNDDSLR
jgi:hypothetical protein